MKTLLAILRAVFSSASEATWTLWIDTNDEGEATTFTAGAWTVVSVVPLQPGLSRVVVVRRLSCGERVRSALAELRREREQLTDDVPPTLDDDGYPTAGTVVSVRPPLPRRPEARPRL